MSTVQSLSRSDRSPARRIAALAGAIALAALVAGCHANHIAESGFPNDYRDRHPIRVAETGAVHEILVGTGRGTLTPVQRAELTAFAGTWRSRATGAVVIEVPSGSSNEFAAAQVAKEARSVLAAAGIPRHGVSLQSYAPGPRETLAPLRVVYPTVKAEVGPCGLWPDDLGVSDYRHHIENRSYWNYGCASQKALAAMVNNPADLVQPRSETPPYGPRRQTVLDKYRQGQDPSTIYPDGEAKASDVSQ